MLLVIANRTAEACRALAQACARTTEPPRPRLLDLDPHTLRDIVVDEPVATTRPSISKPSVQH